MAMVMMRMKMVMIMMVITRMMMKIVTMINSLCLDQRPSWRRLLLDTLEGYTTQCCDCALYDGEFPLLGRDDVGCSWYHGTHIRCDSMDFGDFLDFIQLTCCRRDL